MLSEHGQYCKPGSGAICHCRPLGTVWVRATSTTCTVEFNGPVICSEPLLGDHVALPEVPQNAVANDTSGSWRLATSISCLFARSEIRW